MEVGGNKSGATWNGAVSGVHKLVLSSPLPLHRRWCYYEGKHQVLPPKARLTLPWPCSQINVFGSAWQLQRQRRVNLTVSSNASRYSSVLPQLSSMQLEPQAPHLHHGMLWHASQDHDLEGICTTSSLLEKIAEKHGFNLAIPTPQGSGTDVP